MAQPRRSIEVTQTHANAQPGVYFVTLWATSQRYGDVHNTRTAMQSLDRVRMVVR